MRFPNPTLLWFCTHIQYENMSELLTSTSVPFLCLLLFCDAIILNYYSSFPPFIFFCLQINSLSHVCVMRVCTRTPPTPIFTLRRTMAPFFISWDFSNQRPIKKRGEPRFRTTCQLKVGSAAFFGFVFIVPWHIKTTKRTKHHQRQKFCHMLELRNFKKSVTTSFRTVS